jgi:tetratricopeptide (TPR) repeat protein
VWLLLSLAACATPPQSRMLRDVPPAIPVSTELVEVPFYPQRDYQCGPAALSTVINYYQPQTTPDELLSLVYIPQLKGSLQAEMLAALRQFRMLGVEQDGRLESILREVAAGHPVLVLQNLGLDGYPFWHYAVVIGYDLETQTIILRSGEIERLERPFAVFERTWARSQYWSVAAVPFDAVPETAGAEKFTEAAVALEAFLTSSQAYSMYRNGHRRWPRDFTLVMGAANMKLAQGEYVKAEAYYRSAIELQPARAESWNNLAYALLYQGKKLEALEAIGVAIRQAPNNPEFRRSKVEIEATAVAN